VGSLRDPRRRGGGEKGDPAVGGRKIEHRIRLPTSGGPTGHQGGWGTRSRILKVGKEGAEKLRGGSVFKKKTRGYERGLLHGKKGTAGVRKLTRAKKESWRK